MDPNATLARLRHMVESVQGGAYRESEAPANLDEMTELVGALDGWLSAGGFLPNDWEHVTTMATTISERIMVHSSGADEHPETDRCEWDGCYPATDVVVES